MPPRGQTEATADAAALVDAHVVPETPPLAFAEGGDLNPLPRQSAPAAAPTLADYDDEWGKYAAVAPIPHGTAYAAQPGQPIPASHPKLQEWLRDGYVEAVAKPDAPDAQSAPQSEG